MTADMDRVPWLARAQIDEKAQEVLCRSRAALGASITPPIPIEAIVERVFGYHLLVEDLNERYAHLGLADEDLLGATVVPRREILIHEKLLTDPDRRGRYFFTCAHELAHVVLHQRFVTDAGRAAGSDRPGRDILCRVSLSRKRGEWQADYLAACLLMPETETRKAYRAAVSDAPTCLVNRKSSVCRKGRPLWLEPVLAHAPFYAEAVIQAGNFTNVSRTAMRVRLEELGLLVNAVDRPRVAGGQG
jgi:hypothetical protein